MENTNTESRFYGFGNYYLSSLQQGLQAGHAVAELFVKYEIDTTEHSQVVDWAKNHKTMVLLNGGNSGSLEELYNVFQNLESYGMNYPFAKFHEDEVSLNGALTYVGIVLPSLVYELASSLRSGEMTVNELDNFITQGRYQPFIAELAIMLQNYSLAS